MFFFGKTFEVFQTKEELCMSYLNRSLRSNTGRFTKPGIFTNEKTAFSPRFWGDVIPEGLYLGKFRNNKKMILTSGNRGPLYAILHSQVNTDFPSYFNDTQNSQAKKSQFGGFLKYLVSYLFTYFFVNFPKQFYVNLPTPAV